MEKTNDGGRAFPDPGRAQSAKQRQVLTETGMTLRDYFAAHAPIGVADANDAFYRTHGRNARQSEMLEVLATMRGRYAEAMIADRLNAGAA